MPALDIERELNPQQLEAVLHGEGPQLVLAGAGSGKTRVITYRVAHLVKVRDVDPGSVVAVTFTNKAAGEMRDRVEELLSLYPLPTFVGTFHRYALMMLRRWGERVGVRRGFLIFDRQDQIAMVKKALKEENLSESAFPPRTVLGTISKAKNKLLGPDEFEARADNFFERKSADVYRRYQGLLVGSAGLDFDDMLRLAVKLVEREDDIRERLQRRTEYMLVDEFQDTNMAQMRLITAIAGERANLTAVGDEDQGIYRWRGADIDNVLDFETSFPGAVVRKLERNYRSSGNILSAASTLVEKNHRRRPKRLWTEAADGEKIELYKARDDQDEARWVINTLQGLEADSSWRDMAVLVRTNAQTRAFEEKLLERRIPYELVGGVRFYERAEIKDLVAYLRVLASPRDNFSLLRILNQPPRGIGKSTRELLQESAESFGGSLWEALNHLESGRFPARSAKALGDFHSLLVRLRRAAEELPLPALLDQLLDETRYLDIHSKDNPDSEGRLENIREFLTAAQEFTEQTAWRGEEELLGAFLDHVSLVSDIDSWHSDRGVSLMTLHSAKGLEFETVVVAGLEGGLLPHYNTGGRPDDVEEERRLLYVGMTRAEKRLFLTCARRRRIAGRYQNQEESPFLAELPEGEIEVSESPELFLDDRTRSAYSFFGRKTEERPSAAAASDGGLPKGTRVRHPTLGEGVLLDTEGAGENRKFTVVFDGVGKRKLLSKFAKLERL